MQRNQLHAHLMNMTDEEQYYYQYYKASKDPQTFKKFLDNINTEEVIKKRYVIPDIEEKLDLHFEDESWIWSEENEDIYAVKYARYNPLYAFKHDFNEVVYAYKGEFDMIVDNNIIHMQEGDVCLISPGAAHTMHIFDKDTMAILVKVRKSTFHQSFYSLLFGHEFVSDFFINTIYLGEFKAYLRFRTHNDPTIRDLFETLYLEYFNKQRCYQKIVNSLLCIIFGNLIRYPVSDIDIAMADQAEIKKIDRIMSHIITNYRTITLKELADEFHFAEQYLSKYIKESTGMAFKDIVKHIKLEKAVQLLNTTDFNIQRISEISGYASQEHFMRQFKKEYGTSPSSYRKQNNKLPEM